MVNRFKKAYSVMKDEGITGLFSAMRIRAGRRLMGNSIASIFPKMANYVHPDGMIIPLYAGYRDFIKPGHFIAHTDKAGYPLFWRDNEDNYVRNAGLGGASQFFKLINSELGIDIRNKIILDVGCGDGALAYVLAVHGAAEVHAIDLDFSFRQFNPHHQESLRKAVAKLPAMAGKNIKEIENKVHFIEGDIQKIGIQNQFDMILSLSVLEHICDLRAGLDAMLKLLKSNGIMLHQFNPFFSETGGHEFCILDFPWGHVRLSFEEIKEYLATYRSWEKGRAMSLLENSFNDPKITLDNIDSLFKALGFDILYGSERRAFWWKPDISSNDILAQCRRNYPTITWRDLMSDTVIRLCVKKN